MGFRDDISGDVFDKLLFCLEGVLGVCSESESFADAEDMGVDRHGGLVPNDRTDDVGGLASDTLECLEVIDVIGYDAVVGGDESLRHGDEVLCFGTGVTDRMYVFEHFVGCSGGKGVGCGVGGKEGRGNHVHALVRTLGGEHDCHEALEWRMEDQFAFCYGHVGCKPSDDVLKALLCGHDRN